MKRRLFFFLAVVLLLALPALAQTTTEGEAIDPTILEAILVLGSGAVVSFLTQLIKKALGWTGTLSRVLDGAIGVVVVAVYFVFINPPFDILKFVLYSAVVFGESSGLYHLVKRTA